MKAPTDKSSRAPWARATRPLPRPVSGAHFTVSDAVAFITAQLKPSPTQSRSVADKVGKRIKYALARGHLRPDQVGSIEVNELMLWAKTKAEWTDRLSSFPTVNRAMANEVVAPFETRGVLHSLPVDPDAKDAALAKAHHRILELERTASANEAELARLRPVGVARVERGKAASAAGKRGGRRPKR